MFTSTVIATVGRDTLARAVESILGQSFNEDFEVIVVNDSGTSLSPASWQQSPRVRVIDTNRRERSVARNTGAAAANGRFLHFLDDDDWLAVNGLQQLWQLAQARPVAWLYGGAQLVDRRGQPLIELHHRLEGNIFLPAMAGEWIPLQSSLVASQLFFDIGGFNPQLQGPEDIDLLRRVALRGEVAGTEAIVAHIERGDEGSTTNYRHHPEQSRWAREKIIDAPETFGRLHESLAAISDTPYWRGRIGRLYLTSLAWNLRRGRVLTAVSRAYYLLASMFLAGPQLLTPSFWRSMRQAYASPTFARGFARTG